MKPKWCTCGEGQWAWFWILHPGASPIIFCEVCDQEYKFYDLLDAFLAQQDHSEAEAPPETVEA